MTLIFAQTAWLIPLYPLLAAVLSLCWAPGGLARTGPRPCGYLNLLMVAVAFLHSVVAFISLHQASTGPTPPLFAPAFQLDLAADLRPAIEL